MRLLLIDDDPRYRALVQHHVACEWAQAEVIAHDPCSQGDLPPEFLAQGFDAVLLDHEWPEGRGLDWLQQLTARRGFAPIVFLTEEPDDVAGKRAIDLGAHASLCKTKLSHDQLISAVKRASEKQLRARAYWRTSTAGLEAQRFSGARIPGYRCVRRLSSGVISDLYLAESERAGTLVVIKVTRDKKSGNELDESFKRFLHEYGLVQRIAHPSIVRLYDLGLSDEHAYLVMEYFRGGDLRQRMRTHLSPQEALKYTLEIARSLEATHRSHVLHRDLKPGNVMLRDDGSLALIDFGLAKQEALEMDLTDSGIIFGTPHYMSPEQGHGETVDERSDLYSLGVMLFEMLTRYKPFMAENPMAIIYMHRKSPVPRLTLPVQSLQPLIDRLLAKNPADRFESASALVEALVQLLREAPAEMVA
jgi:DNA-binding NarL/FixJ family response regulator/tRNA A-37 threonylcarbamoyl transferase component Bud32